MTGRHEFLGLGGGKGEMDDSGGACPLYLKAAFGEHLEHSIVAAKNVGLEFGDRCGPGDAAQMLQQYGGNPAPLMFIDYRKGDFGPLRIGAA